MTYFPNQHQTPPPYTTPPLFHLIDDDPILEDSSSSATDFDLVNLEIEEFLEYFDTPSSTFNNDASSRMLEHIFNVLNQIDVNDYPQYAQIDMWIGKSQKNMLHHLCILSHSVAFEQIIKVMVLCPELVTGLDSLGNLPFDYLPEGWANEITDFLIHTPFPGNSKLAKSTDYKWLATLCGLKNPAFALNYMKKAPHALLPIEFENIDNIQEEGRFIPHNPDELPLSILSKRDISRKAIDQFRRLWDENMKEKTGIPSDFFSIYLKTNKYNLHPESFLENLDSYRHDTPLVQSFPTDLKIILQIIEDNNTNTEAQLRRWLFLARTVENTPLEQEFATLTENFNAVTTSPLPTRHPLLARQVIEQCIGITMRTSADICPDNLLPPLTNDPEATLSCLIKLYISEPSDQLELLTKSILEKLKKTTPQKVIIVPIHHIIKTSEQFDTFVTLYDQSITFKGLIDDYVSYTPQNLPQEIGQDRYQFALKENIPFCSNVNSKHITDQFKATGYFAWSDPYPILAPLEIMDEVKITRNTLLQSNGDIPFQSPNIQVNVDFTSEYLLTLTITYQNDKYLIFGYFSMRGLKKFLQKFEKDILEQRPVDSNSGRILRYITKAPPSFNRLTIRNKLPLWITIDYIESNLLIHAIHPQNFTKLEPYTVPVDIFNGIVLDLKRHIKTALHHYKVNFARELTIIEGERIRFHGMHNVRYFQMRFPNRDAQILYHKLETMIKRKPKKLNIIGDPFTNRYFAGWRDQSKKCIVLSANREERMREVIILQQLIPLSQTLQLLPHQLNTHVIESTSKLVHNEPLSISISECMTCFDKLITHWKTDQKVLKYWGTIENLRQDFNSVVSNILYGIGLNTTPAVYRALTIMFTHTLKAYKANNPDQLPAFIKDLANQNGFCINGLKKELWQHYYINFPHALASTELSFFQKTISKTILDFIEQLKRTAVSQKALDQSTHLFNYFRKHLSLYLKIPNDPNTIELTDLSVDPNATTEDVGKDYNPVTLNKIAKTFPLPAMILQLIKQWNEITTSNFEEYPSLTAEFIRLPRSSPLISEERDKKNSEVIQYRKEVEETQAKLQTLKNSRVWRIYSSTKECFVKAMLSGMRKRETRSQAASNKAKRQRNASISSPDLPLSITPIPFDASPDCSSSGSSPPPTVAFMEHSIRDMEQHTLIQEILKLENEISRLNNAISTNIKVIQRVDELFGEELFQRGELTEPDPHTGIQQLTVKGALTWLRLMGVVQDIEPPQADPPNASI